MLFIILNFLSFRHLMDPQRPIFLPSGGPRTPLWVLCRRDFSIYS